MQPFLFRVSTYSRLLIEALGVVPVKQRNLSQFIRRRKVSPWFSAFIMNVHMWRWFESTLRSNFCLHLSSIGHPLLGDSTYGGGKTPFERRHAALLDGQCLHAARLTFVHPATGKEMTFSCPLPPDFSALLGILRRERGGSAETNPSDSGGKV